MENTTVDPMVPPVARDSMAAAPISEKLSERNSSPKPSSRFSSSPSITSNVESRGERPVPPVNRTARQSGSFTRPRKRALICCGSSGTMA